MFKTLEVTLDTERSLGAPQGQIQSFAASTNDYESVKIVAKIIQDKQPVDLSNATVKLAIAKPDKNVVFQNGTVSFDIGGECEFLLETQSYNLSGQHLAEVMIYFADGKIVTTRAFAYQVIRGILNDGAVESTSWYTDIEVLRQLVDELEIEVSGVVTDTTAVIEAANEATQNANEAAESTRLTWKQPVDSFSNLATVYPTPQLADTAMTRDTGKVYRYNGSTWSEIQDIDPAPINEVDNRLTSQLAEKVKKGDLHINVKDFGAKGDGVTDDTQAVKNAIAYMCSLATYEVGASGWKNFMPVLYFPTGRYVISQKGALNCVGGALKGYNIKGAGYLNTEILYTYTPTAGETDDYLLLNGGDNWFGFSYVEDLSIRGNDLNKFWGIKSKAGAPQANRFRRVNFTNLKEAVTIDFGSANANADLFRFDSCKGTNINGWVFGVKTENTSQSVAHTFNDCDFESISGKILYFKSGGIVDARGGSWIVSKTGRVIHCENPTQNGIGTSNNFFTFYGTKFEYQHKDIADATLNYYPLFYNQSSAKIKFVNCNMGQFLNAGFQFTKYDFGCIEKIGSVEFDGCYIPATVAFRSKIFGLSSYGEDTPRLIFRNCRLVNQLNDMVVIEFVDGSSNVGNRPTVIADGCVTIDRFPVDVQLFKGSGLRTLTSKSYIFNFSQSLNPNNGLPAIATGSTDTEKVVSFKLPFGAVVKKVRIVFNGQANGSSYNINVENTDRTVNFLTATHTLSWGFKAFHSSDLYYVIDSETKRTINVVGSGAQASGGGISGHIEIEYF